MTLIDLIVSSLYHSMGNYNFSPTDNWESQVKTLACCIHMAKTTLNFNPVNHLSLNKRTAKDIPRTEYKACRKELMEFLRDMSDMGELPAEIDDTPMIILDSVGRVRESNSL